MEIILIQLKQAYTPTFLQIQVGAKHLLHKKEMAKTTLKFPKGIHQNRI